MNSATDGERQRCFYGIRDVLYNLLRYGSWTVENSHNLKRFGVTQID